jgi:hypothetical protein
MRFLGWLRRPAWCWCYSEDGGPWGINPGWVECAGHQAEREQREAAEKMTATGKPPPPGNDSGS